MAKINIEKKKIDEILDRGVVVGALPSMREFKEKLLKGKKMRFYMGADPTSPSLHLSHAKNYMLLEELRKLGHEVIVLIGDFTARIGDPSGEGDTRRQLSSKEIKGNVKEWLSQISPLMDFSAKENPPRILYNSKWLSKLTMEEIIKLASNFTVQQMVERDMFQERIKRNKPVFLHEFLYPLLQGYDSVDMDVDVELCGTDQIFNALAGRTLLKKIKNKEKFVLIVNLMENPKTKELMSKSRGTGVFLGSSSSDMFRAIMAQPDEMTEIFLVNNTRLGLDRVKEILKEKPMDSKKIAAFEIVKIFHGKDRAETARTSFEKTIQGGVFSDAEDESAVKSGEKLKDCLINFGYVSSGAEFRRLIGAGAIEFEGEVVKDVHYKIKKPGVVRIGKKKFIKLKIS